MPGVCAVDADDPNDLHGIDDGVCPSSGAGLWRGQYQGPVGAAPQYQILAGATPQYQPPAGATRRSSGCCAVDEDPSDGGISGNDAPGKVAEGEATFQKNPRLQLCERMIEKSAFWTHKHYFAPPSFPSPLSFQDWHVDPGIILKHIRLMPSTLHDF